MPPARVAADFGGLLRALRGGGVEFIVVGGVAGAAHGLARATYDLDVVYARSPSNLERLVAAVGPLSPYLRGAPRGCPSASMRRPCAVASTSRSPRAWATSICSGS